jgi:hypothetical protein
MNREQGLRQLYDAFNARNVDAVLAAMVPDVDWPNGWEGGRVTGQEEVRAYWTRQWAEVDSSAQPLAVRERGDGDIEVRVRLLGRTPEGALLFDHEALHVYRFRGDLVERMTIEPAPDPPA